MLSCVSKISTIKYKSGINVNTKNEFSPIYQHKSIKAIGIGIIFILSVIAVLMYSMLNVGTIKS